MSYYYKTNSIGREFRYLQIYGENSFFCPVPLLLSYWLTTTTTGENENVNCCHACECYKN